MSVLIDVTTRAGEHYIPGVPLAVANVCLGL
jgi:hypothetical protein